MHDVAVLALDDVMPFELSIPHRILGSARDRDGHHLYRVVTCSLDGRPVTTAADFMVGVDHGPEAVRTADTVIIPPFGSLDAVTAPATITAVQRLLAEMKAGSRLVSLCGAAFVLAEVGRLAGRPATTHWSLTGSFRREFPDVDLDPGLLFIDDGDVLTAAGGAAGIDLCLHLVRSDHGADAANRVARWCVVPPHRDGGQRQYIEHAVPAMPDTTTGPTREWAMERLSERLSLSTLARQANMSTRTFSRRFRAETGQSPNRWLLQQRIELARRLLEDTDLPVEMVATEAGLGSATGMREHFRRMVGVSPSSYRRRFRTHSN